MIYFFLPIYHVFAKCDVVTDGLCMGKLESE